MAQHVTITKNYSLFHLMDNRPLKLDTPKRRALRELMARFGWLMAFPLAISRRDGKMYVRDGQHRLAFAKELGLPVPYTEIPWEVKPEDLNRTQAGWALSDFVGIYAKNNPAYQELLSFSSQHKIPLSTAAAMLSNNSMTRHILDKIKDGSFKITTRQLADRAARMYVAILSQGRRVVHARLVEALFALCQVPDLDDSRIITGIVRCIEIIKPYSTRDGYLEMLEYIYNYGRKIKFPLKIEAENAMRRRNPANKGK